MCFRVDEEKEKEECPWVLSVSEMGIRAERERGCLADEEWLSSFVIANHHSFFHHRVYIDLPHKKLTYLRTVSQGQFGYIDLARYDTVERSMEVYVKRPILTEATSYRRRGGDGVGIGVIGGKHYPTAIYEPYLQQLVREGMARYGLPDHVPRVLEVFALHNGTVCFAMEEVEGATVMDAYLHEGGQVIEEVSRRMKEILWHVAVMVWVMNGRLGVNHRDLKPSNFLVRRRTESVVHQVEIEGLLPFPLTWSTTLHLSLIDFGFACAGSLETHRAHLSLSTVYSRADPCPKDGRDMFLFLGYLYSDYHSLMTEGLRKWFEEWLAIPGSDLCGFLRKDSDISKRWLYYLSGSESVFQLRSSPVTVLRYLQGQGI
jgi:serine/threonine protein kinase